jgi:hypothetical protein
VHAVSLQRRAKADRRTAYIPQSVHRSRAEWQSLKVVCIAHAARTVHGSGRQLTGSKDILRRVPHVVCHGEIPFVVRRAEVVGCSTAFVSRQRRCARFAFVSTANPFLLSCPGCYCKHGMMSLQGSTIRWFGQAEHADRADDANSPGTTTHSTASQVHASTLPACDVAQIPHSLTFMCPTLGYVCTSTYSDPRSLLPRR